MISSREFIEAIRQLGVEFFAGVPDSLLKALCAEIERSVPLQNRVTTANEGNAVALALGYYLGTGRIGAVYLQNSGLGNTINPLTSLADREVYGVPMVLIIGWRGEPGVKDEPQHVKQGRITQAQLDVLEIPYWIIDSESDWRSALQASLHTAQTTSAPVALLVRSQSFAEEKQSSEEPRYQLRREEALRLVLDQLRSNDLVVASTGHISREVYEYRQECNTTSQQDFLTVGGMGHTSSIALALAMAQPSRRVVCLDGDGSVLMHMGMLAVIGSLSPTNLYHFILNNGAHDSVGGQPTVGFDCDFAAIAGASGYRRCASVATAEDLASRLDEALGENGPTLFEIRVRKGARANLGRPQHAPEDNRRALMENLGIKKNA